MKLCRILAVCWSLCLAAAWGGEVLKPSETKMKDALHAVITQQLEAFRAGDYQLAYGFADEAIKAVYSLEKFQRMVKTSYPAIATSLSATCGLTFDNGDEAVVNVRVVAVDKTVMDYQYTLHRTDEAWRITGVVLLESRVTEV